MKIPSDEYARIVERLPILCVDIVIRNPQGQYLLIKRANEPLKDEWWVIGGRVLKGETLKEAALRKAKEEAGLSIQHLKLFGYYEDSNETNPFGRPTPLHSVSVVFSAAMNERQPVRLDEQSSDWKFSKDLPEQFLRTLLKSREGFMDRE